MAGYFFESYVKPAIIRGNYQNIVEIGVDEGANTLNLIEVARELNANLYCIDPGPGFEPNGRYAKLIMLKKPSLQALKSLKSIDCAIIDGDHNWYTVYNELKMVDERLVAGGTVFLHDVLWPYGRRDMYYEPQRVPRKYRHPHEKVGILPGEFRLSTEGINGEFYNAVYEGGSQNGVLTAVEDFLRTAEGYDFTVVQEEHGLAILDKQGKIA